MGKLANNYVQLLLLLYLKRLIPPPLSHSGTVSLMQAVLHYCLKKSPSIYHGPCAILISINTL